jgi:hypothetical protein
MPWLVGVTSTHPPTHPPTHLGRNQHERVALPSLLLLNNVIDHGVRLSQRGAQLRLLLVTKEATSQARCGANEAGNQHVGMLCSRYRVHATATAKSVFLATATVFACFWNPISI